MEYLLSPAILLIIIAPCAILYITTLRKLKNTPTPLCLYQKIIVWGLTGDTNSGLPHQKMEEYMVIDFRDVAYNSALIYTLQSRSFNSESPGRLAHGYGLTIVKNMKNEDVLRQQSIQPTMAF